MIHRKFLTEFFRNRKEIGSVAPSWPLLVKKMLAPIDFQSVQTIVELGAGEGVITRQLVKRARPETEILVFEMNPDFCALLQAVRHPNVRVIRDSAEHLLQYTRQADVVVSSLPLTNMSTAVEASVMQSIDSVLKPGGLFLQYQYHKRWHEKFEAEFQEVERDFVFWNLPPAWVYHCRKEEELVTTSPANTNNS